MYPDCPGKLCETGYGSFNLFSCGHYKIGKFIYNKNNIWKEFMTVFRIKLSCLEFDIVFLDISYHGILQKIIPVIHLYTQGIKRIYNLVIIGYNSILGIGQFCKVMSFDFIE